MRVLPNFSLSAGVPTMAAAAITTVLSTTQLQAATYTMDFDNSPLPGAEELIDTLSVNREEYSIDGSRSITEFLLDKTTVIEEENSVWKAIVAGQTISKQEQGKVSDTYTMSPVNSDGLVSLVIQPIGVVVDAQPITFTHVSGPVGIAKEEVEDGSFKQYVFAAVGIDTNSIVMTQVNPDPRGNHAVGEKVPMTAPDINHSENSRVSAMFTPEMGAIEELQIVLPHDADPKAEITLSLKNNNGETTEVLDANDYQIIPANKSRFANVAEIGDVPDFLVLVIKNDAEALSKIYDTILANGNFEVNAMSPMGRLVPTPFAFGEGMADHLEKTYAELERPSFYFYEASQNLQRRIVFDPKAEPVDHDVKKCVFLGLQDMDAQALSKVRVVPGTETDGTGIRPRSFKALVALDEFNNLVAAGSQAWWGVNYVTNQARVSGSAPTGFLTNGGELLSGCTADNVTQMRPPMTTETFNLITQLTTGVTTSSSTSTNVTVTPGGGGSEPKPKPEPETPTLNPVPIEGAEWIVVKAAGQLDKATGFTRIEEPVRNFFDKHWTPLEPGPLLLGSALLGLGGVARSRRKTAPSLEV